MTPEVAALLKRAQFLSNGLREYAERNRLFRYYPDQDTPGFPARAKYPKHLEFYRRGRDVFGRLMMGAVGVGKTEAAGYEVACHLRGWYPDWWEGHRFERPILAWIAGDTRQTTRDIQQTKLLGRPYEEGTGIIPADWIDFDSIKRVSNPAGAIDTLRIHRQGGGHSYIAFKSYDQGIDAFFGAEVDLPWCDELVPLPIFAQCVARTRNRDGARIITTFAPVKGKTDVVELFEDQPDPSRLIVRIGWADAPHLTEEYKNNTRAATPSYQLPAVEFGIATRGAGAVYQIDESRIVCDPFAIPSHFRWVFGFDGGFHNTAVVWIAYDADKDTAYVVSDYCDGGVDRASEEPIDYSIHAARIRARNMILAGFEVPGVGDAAAINQSNGDKILTLYKAAGINLSLADKSVDLGISAVLERLASGKLKVFKTCEGWLKEFRNYAVDEKGKIVKKNDHRMDATRYAIVSGLKKARNKAINTVTPIRTVGIRR